jgi:1,4-dihydroxy-2-naphthoate polyprenyltransferase
LFPQGFPGDCELPFLMNLPMMSAGPIFGGRWRMENSKVRLWVSAFTGFYRPGVEEVKSLDVVSRFLFAARSVILVISAQAAIIAGLLAAGDGQFSLPNFLGVLVGFVVAHMISNLSNDYFGFRRGHDTPDSPRMRYTVHPLTSGVLDNRSLLVGLAILGVIGLGLTALFIHERGWLAALFAASGIALLFLYDAAPTPLKSIGLGEAATLLVWGPLMIGGGYAMISGTLSSEVILASLPYGLGVMSILTGKHIDQLVFDSGRGIRTMPVIIGEARARQLNIAAVVLMYAIIAALIYFGGLTPFCALVGLALPRAVSAVTIMSRPRPAVAPPGYVGWPLWYHRVCLVHNRLFGWLYIAGLTAGLVWRLVS